MVLELGDLLAVDVNDHHVVPKVRKASGSRETHVTGADDRDFAQTGPIISVRILLPRRSSPRVLPWHCQKRV